MGSRGRMLGQAHWSEPGEYKCIDIRNNVKILQNSQNPKHPSLPDISHTKGTTYISLDKNGIFHQMRIYDYAGHPKIDIDYGIHPSLSKQATLHIHKWKGGRDNGVRLFTISDLKKIRKVFERNY